MTDKPSGKILTLVHPIGEAAAVTYLDVEIDEVDSGGCLRLATSRASGAQCCERYVVWAPGTWQRAETRPCDG